MVHTVPLGCAHSGVSGGESAFKVDMVIYCIFSLCIFHDAWQQSAEFDGTLEATKTGSGGPDKQQ
jgi:hypothetical protein